MQQVSQLLLMVEQERIKSGEKANPEPDQNVRLPAEIEEVKTMLLAFYFGDLILAENDEKKGLTEIDAEALQNYLSEQVAAILQNVAKKAYLLA